MSQALHRLQALVVSCSRASGGGPAAAAAGPLAAWRRPLSSSSNLLHIGAGGARSTSDRSNRSGAAARLPSFRPRTFSTAASRPVGEARPVTADSSSSDPVVPESVRPGTLKGLPAPEVLRRLKIKTQQKGNMPRLSEFHLLLRACKGGPDDGAAVEGGLELFLFKNVQFRTETTTLFLDAARHSGRLDWAVECILDRRKRLGIWAGQSAFHRLLLELGRAKDSERLLRVWAELPGIGLFKLTPRSLHLLVKGLVATGQADKARQLVAEATQQQEGLSLKDITKELLEQAAAQGGSPKEAEGPAAPVPAEEPVEK